MTFWSVRESLSQANKLRRSYYELLRDDLDQFLLQYALVDSYNNFLSKNTDYPFVEKRELKPRARITDIEYEAQNTFLIIFVEDSISADHKKYISFYDINKTTKDNILKSKTLPLSCKFDRTQKFFDSARFFDFTRMLLPVDYALLIQRDPASRINDRYILSHFHVRIDWPVMEAAENLASNLRYISKDIYEKGDKYAEDIQKKFYEYYALPVMAGGRRTAAIVAAQYFKRIPCITTVYVGSSGSRALIRISERGVSKAILMKLGDDEINQISTSNFISPNVFKKHYVVAKDKKDSICIFQVIYSFTDHARPPDDGKLRELRPDLYWQAVEAQYILPVPGVWKYPPLPYNIIYS
ncbi:MAG: hypothetical protein ABIK92_10740 [Pseudomonadota bacterium]